MAFRAYRNRCPHQQGPVCTGPVSGTLVATADTDWRLAWVLEGRVLICPWHSMEFDLDSGRRIRAQSERPARLSRRGRQRRGLRPGRAAIREIGQASAGLTITSISTGSFRNQSTSSMSIEARTT